MMIGPHRLLGAALGSVLALATPQPLHPGEIRVPILVYHNVAPHRQTETAAQRAYDVAPSSLEAQLRYLQDHHIRVVPLATLVAALRDRSSGPDRAVVLTFDDGWATQYANALPLLRRFGVTATFFVFTNPIGKDARFLTWGELRNMQAAGMSIGSHSKSHPYLTKLDPPALRDEIAGSRRALEAQVGVPIDYFAYPFGEHSAALEQAVRDAGYAAARAFPGGLWNGPADLFALRAVEATDDLVAFRRIVDPAVGGGAPVRRMEDVHDVIYRHEPATFFQAGRAQELLKQFAIRP
jgi:peptidoglycan/xylan/chitin deacetylase (PgdA/CDA1 family)